MNPIETLAVTLSVVILVKALLFLVKKDAILHFRNTVLRRYSKEAQVFCLLLLIPVGYVVLSVYSLVEIAAVMLFTLLVFDIHLLTYPNAIRKLSDDALKGPLPWTAWIWVVFAVYVLWSIFA